MLSFEMINDLFPEATILKENLLGIIKSYTAVYGWNINSSAQLFPCLQKLKVGGKRWFPIRLSGELRHVISLENRGETA